MTPACRQAAERLVLMMTPRGLVIARALAFVVVLLSAPPLRAEIITFEDLALAPGSHNSGPMPGAVSSPGPYPGTTQYTGSFTSGSASFVNRFLYDPSFPSWDGFAYSNEVDTTTAGFGNQYSSFAGADHTPSGNGVFGIATGYLDGLTTPTLALLEQLPHFSVPVGMAVAGAYVTNTTYAALSMRDGDTFAKKFGGLTGDDPDYLRIRAFGVDSLGNVLSNTAEFYLSDYRSADNSQDYIVNDWRAFDLSALTGASAIYFNLETTDVGAFGSNTPMFFAIDDIQLSEAVPEPSSLILAMAAGGTLWRLSRRRRSSNVDR